jgi:Domain of unknown function (DUF4405)
MIQVTTISRSKLNLFLDLTIALAFVMEMEEHFTGLRIHELLGLAFGVGIVVHLALHWKWIVNVTRSFFQKLFHESRLNYVLNLALFADILVVIVTGILISRTLGLNFGGETRTIQQLHSLSSQLSLIFVGLHIALHWKWILAHSQKYLLKLPWQKRTIRVPVSQDMMTSQEN